MLFTPSFWAMALANLCNTASFSAFFLLPLYILELGGDQGDIGIIMGIFAMASALCRPWVSEMVDKVGRKRSFSIGCLLMVSAPFLYLAVPDPLGSGYVPFLLLRILHGIGLAICFTSVFTFMADILPQERLNEGIGLFGISGLIGIAIGPILGEITYKSFGAIGLFLVAGGLATTALVTHLPLKESGTIPEHVVHVSFFSLFRRTKFIIVGLLSLLFGLGLAGTGNFVAPLAESRQLGYVSVYYFCYSSGAVAIRFIGGKLADRFGENTIFPYSIVLYMTGILLLPLTHNLLLLCCAGLLSGVGHGLLFPLLNTMAVRGESSEIRGKATGIFTGGIDTGIFAGSFILGYIGNWFGLNTLFVCAGLSMAAGFIIFRFHGSQQVQGQ